MIAMKIECGVIDGVGGIIGWNSNAARRVVTLIFAYLALV